MNLNDISKPVLFYDGQCNLCNGAVQFVLRHEKNDQIVFASLQSALGKMLISKFELQNVDSLVLYHDGEIYLKSSAALHIAKNLKQPYRKAHIIRFLPVMFRDFIYDFVARHRYAIFGKTESCQLPNKKHQKRFLDL